MTDLADGMTRALLKIGERARELAWEDAPYRSGDLRSSLTVQETRDEVVVGTALDYALYVHQGTGLYGPHQQRITPVRKKALAWPGAPHPVKSVAGQHPQPFLETALEKVRAEVEILAAPDIGQAAAAQLHRALRDATIDIILR